MCSNALRLLCVTKEIVMSNDQNQYQHLFKNSETSPSRSRFMSAQDDAGADIRRVCNSIKKLTKVGSVSVFTGRDYRELQSYVDDICLEVLDKLGFNTQDQHRMAVLLAMISEPVSGVVADAIKQGADFLKMKELAPKVVTNIVDIAKSTANSKMLNEQYPADMDITAALRVAMAVAFTGVASEFRKYDFLYDAGKCTKEASSIVLKTTLEAVKYLTPEHASAASKSILTQSLLTSNSNLYAACVQAAARFEIKAHEGLSSEQIQEVAAKRKGQRPAQILAVINQSYLDLLDITVNLAVEPLPEVAIQTAASKRPLKP